MSLILTGDQVHVIKAQVTAALPAEACGLLTGRRAGHLARVERLWPADNLLAHVPGRFELDPAIRFQAERACRHNGSHVLGHWHSHPGGSATPSVTDRLQAYEPDLIWLIVAVGVAYNHTIRAWRISAPGARPRPVRLKVEGGP